MLFRLTVAVLLLSAATLVSDCQAGGWGRRHRAHPGPIRSGGPIHPPKASLAAYQNPSLLNWHRGYYNTQYGAPLALVVPPTAFTHTEFGWGVGTTRVSPIYPQFGRPFPGPLYGGQGFLPTPLWPSDTTQFGVYYVRGPW
jgi:hypothetical protein